jgi:glycosyltransferase involved in cell wall biosynthesis
MESHVQTLALAQAELGAEVSVLCVSHLDRANRDVTFDRFATTVASEEHDGPVRVNRLARWASLARFDFCPRMLASLRQLRRKSFDLLHLHTPNPTMLIALSGVLPRVPLVVTHHSDVIRQKKLELLQRPFENAVYGRAGRVLATSPRYAEGSPTLQRYADKCVPLPLGIDLRPFESPSPAVLAHEESIRRKFPGPIWLSVGRLVYYKGLATGLEALASVPGQWLIVGTGPLEAELKQRAAELGVADRVTWLGRLSPDELGGAYRAATALWFPSNARSEGFGLVQVEAMASGCPVINTHVPASGVAWVSRHDIDGLTVPVGDGSAFAAAAQRLLKESGLRERFAAAARERARDFDRLTMARASLAIYSEISR